MKCYIYISARATEAGGEGADPPGLAGPPHKGSLFQLPEMLPSPRNKEHQEERTAQAF